MTTDEASIGKTASAAGKRTSITLHEEIDYPEKIRSLWTVHPPQQRQRWSDTQVLPHVNWGDLFFDLFYVAAAYNLSGIITESPNKQGIFYFLACFGPIMSVWTKKTYFDSRFAIHDDPLHRLFEIVMLCFLGTCVLHISTVEDLSHPSKHADMFAFSLGMTLLSAGTILRCTEVYLRVTNCGGDRNAATASARRDVLIQGVPFTLYLTAAIYSGIKFYHGPENEAVVISSGAAAPPYDNGGYRFRFLAAEAGSAAASYLEEYEQSHVAISLCLAGYLAETLPLAGFVVFFMPRDGSHKKIQVPMNISFTIHRYGEWTMLLLGESILSLLIVDVSDSLKYYVTFYAGIVSTILLQYLHFRSQPHHADDHAMRRNKDAGVFFSLMMQVYSFALVLIGVSFKMMLYEYTFVVQEDYEEGDHNRARRVLRSAYTTVTRYLAGGGGGDSGYSMEEIKDRQQRVAHIFCGSMAVAWLALDLMILSHMGYAKNAERCHCEITKGWNITTIVFGLSRVLLIVFIATLSQYVQDPEKLALIGLASIFAQVITRVVGDWVVPSSVAPHDGGDSHHGDILNNSGGVGIEREDSEEGHWPNTTHAVSRKEPIRIKDTERQKPDSDGDGDMGVEVSERA